MKTTFAIIKPTSVEERDHGDILRYIVNHRFTILRLETRTLTLAEVQLLYHEHVNRDSFDELCQYMIRSPVVIMELSLGGCEEVVKEWRDFIGATNPDEAKKGTLRRLYGNNRRENAVHGSDSDESAAREINIFWPDF